MQGVNAIDLYQLKSVTQPFAVNDQTFFVQNSIDQATNQYRADIWSLDDDGKLQQWTDEGMNLDPVICQENLYYRHKDDAGRFQLMAMPIDGGIAHQITDGDSISELHLTSDQNNLVFKSVHTPTATKYATTNRPQIRHITKLDNRADGIGWLPNDYTYSLILLDLKTYQTIEIFKQRHDFTFQSISPAQTQVLYLAAMHPELTTAVDDTKGVYLYDIDTKQTRLLTASLPQGVFTNASFSKDGQQVAMVGNDGAFYSGTVNALYLYDLQAATLTNVTKDHDDVDVGFAGSVSADFAQNRHETAVQWLDDGRYLCHAYHHGHSQLYLGEGTTFKLVSDKKRDIYDFTLKDDQHVMVSSSTSTKPCLLTELDLTSLAEGVEYNPNQSYEKAHQYAKVDAFNYPSNDGDVQLSGWVMHARSTEPKSPVILYVHGGPHAAYGESFFHEFQVLASHGFNVVYVNPRGSTTYGQAFQKDVMGHYGEHDFQDVLAGLDYALAHFADLDADKTFIAGGSYGGFMSTWAVGHTDRFQAAIAQRPLVDWQAMYGTSDIGIRFARAELGYDLFDDENAHAIYWDKSPLKYAHNVKTPLRIQHGEYDMRCPVNQSEAFYTAVKQTGTDCDYIRYPQSYHGMSRNGIPNLRVQRINDIIEWFRRY